MLKLKTLFFTVLLLGFSGGSFGQFGLFGPSDYDECILEGMKGVTSDLAAQAIVISCRAKFPEEIKKNRNSGKKLTADELAKVQLNDGKWLSDDYIDEFIYNGNDFGIKNVLVAYSLNNESTLLQRFELVFAPYAGSCIRAKTSVKETAKAFPFPKNATGWGHRLMSAVKC